MTQSDLQPVSHPEKPDDPITPEEELLFLDDDLSVVDEENNASQNEQVTENPLEEDAAKAQAESAVAAAQELVPRLESDPIRLYFNDIGKVDLLGIDQEFWLSARMMAVRRLDNIGRQHPIARRGVSPVQGMYRAVFAELRTAWNRVRDDIKRWKFACPDLLSILNETRSLREAWDIDQPSYLRNYLDNGMWGKDTFWDTVARYAFTIFLSFYALPEEASSKLSAYLEKHHKLPLV